MLKRKQWFANLNFGTASEGPSGKFNESILGLFPYLPVQISARKRSRTVISLKKTYPLLIGQLVLMPCSEQQLSCRAQLLIGGTKKTVKPGL